MASTSFLDDQFHALMGKLRQYPQLEHDPTMKRALAVLSDAIREADAWITPGEGVRSK